MTFFRALGRGFLIVLISMSLAAWIVIATVNATILQRSVVLGWIDKSGVYSTFVGSIVELMPSEGQEKQLLSETTIRQAITSTLPPAFIKSSAESIINASYDWLEGKTQTISFSIPLADKRPELEKNLAGVIESQIDDLPVCSTKVATSDDITCIPQGITAASMADDLSRRSVESSDFLSKPLTPEGFSPTQIPGLAILRWFAQIAPFLVIGLPIFAAVGIGLYVLLYDNKLLGLRIAARRIFFATILTTVLAGAVWLFNSQISLSAFGDQAIITSVVDPLFHQIANNVAMWLFIFSGSVLAVSGGLWLTVALIEKRQRVTVSPHPPTKPQNLPPVPPNNTLA